MSEIETKQLTKSYGKARGIIDINLRIEEGEIYGFIGPNGAGKSTTIRLLLGLLFPTSGGGTIYGLDIVKNSPEIKKGVGFVPSEIYYYDGLTKINISKNPSGRDSSPQININGDVVWVRYAGADSEIVYFDRSTATRTVISVGSSRRPSSSSQSPERRRCCHKERGWARGGAKNPPHPYQ